MPRGPSCGVQVRAKLFHLLFCNSIITNSRNLRCNRSFVHNLISIPISNDFVRGGYNNRGGKVVRRNIGAMRVFLLARSVKVKSTIVVNELTKNDIIMSIISLFLSCFLPTFVVGKLIPFSKHSAFSTGIVTLPKFSCVG